MPRGRYQQVQWEERETAIVDTLERLSLERGFDAVTMDDVANKIGISKATLYQHFKSKESMLEHLLLKREDEFINWFEGTTQHPPLQRLQETMRYLMEGHITPLRGLVSLGYEEVRPVFVNSDALTTRHAQIIEMLTAVIEAGQAEGSIASDLTPGAVIGAMIALSQVNYAAQHDKSYAEQMVLMFQRALHSTGKDNE